jgi:hypothetical protein
MKSLPAIAVAALLTFCSCTARKRQQPPAILEGKKIDVSSIYKKRGADLVEALYEELLAQSEELKKLDTEIKSLLVSVPDSMEAFTTYHEKSVQYYDLAEKKANGIGDSTLRKTLLDYIGRSRQSYRDSLSIHTRIDSLVQKRIAAINDLHQSLKLMSTLPLIEEFQQSNRPDTFNATALIQRMGELVSKLDSVTASLRQKVIITPDEKQ